MCLSDDNHQTYEQSSVVKSYQADSSLSAAEVAIFDILGPSLASSRMLDIGVGAGRTTTFLAPAVKAYVGIDYSAGLVEAARRRHPGVTLELCDARDLSQFEDRSFDIVNFSFNGIDYVDHDDRLRILTEVHRVLAPGGVWTFSSHNRDYERRGKLPWQGRFKPGRVMLKKSIEALRARDNRRRLRAGVVENDVYALVNDEAHGYSLLTYYISVDTQRDQLNDAGFESVEVLDQWGRRIMGTSRDSMWLHYLCRRA